MTTSANSYGSLREFLSTASAFWSVDLVALNSSGVAGTAILALGEDSDGTPHLAVAISATGATPGVSHLQHIHGTFDAEGNVTDAVEPTLAQDTDGDGFVEVLEGVPVYGDVIMSLDTGSDHSGHGPAPHDVAGAVANAAGEVSFVRVFDLTDAANLLSPVTGTQYTMEDLMPLAMRHIVFHGMSVPAGYGEGSANEVNGMQDGYVPILPAATGEIEGATAREAMRLLKEHLAQASETIDLGRRDDTVDAGAGNDTVMGRGGDDTIQGGGDDDRLVGGAGDDMLTGGEGADTFIYARAGSGRDTIADFEAGVDDIDLSALDLRFRDLEIRENGAGDAVVRFAGTTVVFEGVGADVLTAGDFLF